jgi:hypothetical protein
MSVGHPTGLTVTACFKGNMDGTRLPQSGVSGHGVKSAGLACADTLSRQPLHLYGYLWCSPARSGDDVRTAFSFVVPDTVFFKQHAPAKWFFTSKKEKGKVRGLLRRCQVEV